MFADLISNPLSHISRTKKDNIFIVIDGLDETLDDKDKELISLIGSGEFEKGLPGNVKIIVTSRPEPKLEQTPSRLNPIVLNAEEKENEKDCSIRGVIYIYS